MLRYIYICAIGCALLSAVWGCGGESQVKVLKLAVANDAKHPVVQALYYMAERLEKISEGKMKITVYPSGQLGSEQQCIELLQLGSLAMTKVSCAPMESFADEFKLFGLPYIFRSHAHRKAVTEGPVGEKILLSVVPKLMRGLCFYDAGARSFYMKDKPILHPDDLQGKKIRVMKSKTSMQTISILGGMPSPIPYGELYTALQGGVVDGAENNPPSLYSSNHYALCKHYSLDEHTAIPDILLISTYIWERLSEVQKKWLTQAVKESVAKQAILWEEAEEKAFEEMKEDGVKVYQVDKQLFIDKVQPLHQEYRENPKFTDLLNEIENIKE